MTPQAVGFYKSPIKRPGDNSFWKILPIRKSSTQTGRVKDNSIICLHVVPDSQWKDGPTFKWVDRKGTKIHSHDATCSSLAHFNWPQGEILSSAKLKQNANFISPLVPRGKKEKKIERSRTLKMNLSFSFLRWWGHSQTFQFQVLRIMQEVRSGRKEQERERDGICSFYF